VFISIGITNTRIGNIIQSLAGDDTLVGNAGSDTLTGGLGSDTFDYNSNNDGHDIITDFLE
jgi:Ca2+-binding RTX toxin-like protein